MSFLDLYKQQIERFNQEVADLDGKNTNFNHTRPELGKKLYLLTKNFLDTYPDALNADEKAAVFEEYVRLWFASKCLLDIKDTRYAEAYKQSSFGKFGGGYNDRCPMTAGFNLSGARLKSQHADFIFLHVNFNKADFSKLTWVYGHFENCLMSQIQTTDQTNLNQSRFERCTLNSNDLTKVGLCESRLTGCSIIDTQLPKYISKRDCVDKAPYPTFLQQLQRL